MLNQPPRDRALKPTDVIRKEPSPPQRAPVAVRQHGPARTSDILPQTKDHKPKTP